MQCDDPESNRITLVHLSPKEISRADCTQPVIGMVSHRLNMTCSERHVAALWTLGASPSQAHPLDISETDACAAHVRTALQLPHERALVCTFALNIPSSHPKTAQLIPCCFLPYSRP